MAPNNPQVSRAMVGVAALVCLLAGAALWIAGVQGQQWDLWKSGFVRVGLLVGALWIAMPTKTRSAAWSGLSWMTFAGVILLAVAATRVRLVTVLPIAVAVATIGAFLRPREKHRPATRVER